jgi:hypothetical protein
MAKTRPCRICHVWFPPAARAGDRQHVCGKPECQQEWHRRNCAQWHERHPGYDQETRLRKRLTKATPVEERKADPLRAIDWDKAKAVVGLEAAVLIEEAAKVVVQGARDSVRLQTYESKRVISKVHPRTARDPVPLQP